MLGSSGGGGDLWTSGLSWLGQRGGRPLEVAVRLDLLRSLGPAAAIRRLRGEARAAALRTGAIRPGYRRLWGDAAERIGAEISDLGEGFLEVSRGGVSARLWHSWVDLDDAVTLRFAENKALSRRALASAGLPVPEVEAFELDAPRAALEFLAGSNGPVVIKPAGAAGGSGATTGVRTAAQLKRACLRAGRLGRRLLIERQIEGALYRVLVLDGEVLDVIRRDPPAVIGDGRSTIAELVGAENEARIAAAGGRRPGLLRIDLDAIFSLEHQGLRASSVPAAGERILIKAVVNQNSRKENVNAREEMGESPLAEAVQAAETVGVRLAGVDLITPDPKVALQDAGGAIIEVNGTPGLHYHYEVADPDRSVAVAIPILERALAIT